MNEFKVTYTSSNGKVFNLLVFDDLKLEKADFHSYKWGKNVSSRQFGDKLNYFTKSAQTYKCTLLLNGSPANRRAKLEAFTQATEYDITHKTPGRIAWGLDYIECYLIESDTKPRKDGGAYTERTFTAYCPYPYWIEEVHTLIQPSTQGIRDTDKGYDDSYPYPYSYPYAPNAVFVNVDHYTESPFKLIVYGPCTDVNINISGNIYKVDHAVLAGQYMVIDSRPNIPADRECYIVSASGIITNTFDYRDPAYELLKPIPMGDVVVTFERTHAAELTLYMERSEPRWKES